MSQPGAKMKLSTMHATNKEHYGLPDLLPGGALMGVVSAVIAYCNINLIHEEWLNNPMSEIASLGAYILLILFLVKASLKLKHGSFI